MKLLNFSWVLAAFIFTVTGCSPRKAPIYSQTPVKISAEELYKEYKDRETADKKYLGKLLEVSGVIERTGEDTTGQPFVILKGGDNLGAVQCFLLKTLRDQMGQLKTGQQIALKGIGLNKIINVTVDECEILQPKS